MFIFKTDIMTVERKFHTEEDLEHSKGLLVIAIILASVSGVLTQVHFLENVSSFRNPSFILLPRESEI